jgi:hypothetical protein
MSRSGSFCTAAAMWKYLVGTLGMHNTMSDDGRVVHDKQVYIRQAAHVCVCTGPGQHYARGSGRKQTHLRAEDSCMHHAHVWMVSVSTHLQPVQQRHTLWH